MNFERIFTAAKNSKPSEEQLQEFAKRDAENAKHNSYDHVHSCKTPRSALTGWTGQTLDVDSVQWASGYAEPGYTDPKKAILFGDWNDVSRRVQDILDRAGYALEWEDEWSTCSDCGKAVRTTADSYSWQRSYWPGPDECEVICRECLDVTEYLESLEDNSAVCNTFSDIDPEEHGYVKLNKDRFESGFHPGQNDRPVDIVKALREKGEKRPLIFSLDYAAQFDIGFSVYAKLADDCE